MRTEVHVVTKTSLPVEETLTALREAAFSGLRFGTRVDGSEPPAIYAHSAHTYVFPPLANRLRLSIFTGGMGHRTAYTPITRESVDAHVRALSDRGTLSPREAFDYVINQDLESAWANSENPHPAEAGTWVRVSGFDSSTVLGTAQALLVGEWMVDRLLETAGVGPIQLRMPQDKTWLLPSKLRTNTYAEHLGIDFGDMGDLLTQAEKSLL